MQSNNATNVAVGKGEYMREADPQLVADLTAQSRLWILMTAEASSSKIFLPVWHLSGQLRTLEVRTLTPAALISKFCGLQMTNCVGALTSVELWSWTQRDLAPQTRAPILRTFCCFVEIL
jgi:hypothetical protein